MTDNTAVNPQEVLLGGDYSLPEDPKLLKVLVVQTAKMTAHQLLPRRDEFSEKISGFLDRLDAEHFKLFNDKFRGYIDKSIELIEADLAVISKHRKDWVIGLAQSKASPKFLEGLKGLRKKEE